MWTEEEIEEIWDAMRYASLENFGAGYRHSGGRFEAPAFELDAQYKYRLYWYLKPLAVAMEHLNREERLKLETQDAEAIFYHFSPWTTAIDHLTFAVASNRLEEVTDIFQNTGFRVCDKIEPSEPLLARGIMLAKENPSSKMNLSVSLLEEMKHSGMADRTSYLRHVLQYGERTPFRMTLDIHRILPVGNRVLYRKGENYYWSPIDAAKELLDHFITYKVLPMAEGNVESFKSKRRRGVYFSKFSTLPLKYGLRLEFLRRHQDAVIDCHDNQWGEALLDVYHLDKPIVEETDQPAKSDKKSLFKMEAPRGYFPI